MDSKTALEIFRLFNMSDKTDDQIMAIVSNTHYAKEACRAAAPFLKTENNILKLMDWSFYDEETCIAALKALKLEEWTENKILDFIYKIPEGNNRNTVKKISVSYFKLKEKKEYQIINLFKKVKYDAYFRDACIKALNLPDKTDDQLQSIIELLDFQEYVCYEAIQCFKEEESILLLMEREGTTDFVLRAGADRIKWEGKTEDQALNAIRRGQYNSHLCELGLSSLKKQSDILFIMEKGQYYGNICEIGIPLLNLSEKTVDELFDIMSESKYNYHVCNACFKFLALKEKSNAQLLDFMKRTGFNPFVCMRMFDYFTLGSKEMDYEGCIIEVMEDTGFDVRVCRSGLPLLKEESSISHIMRSSGYKDKVCQVGITLLKDEKNIFDIMEKTNFESGVCEAGVKTMATIKANIQKRFLKKDKTL